MSFLSPKRILLIESTGYRLRGAIARNRNGQVQITHLAESSLIDPQAAVADVIDQLSHFRLPSKALLLTHDAIAAVVELPVDPAVPRSVPQMNELIRWELDAVFAQVPTAPPIGEILVARGHLTYDQVQLILSEQESLLSSNGNRSFGGNNCPRFGDIALKLELFSNAQIEEALTLQTLLRKDDDQDCQCSWSPISKAVDNFSDQFQWLVCGISDSKHRKWVESFDHHRIDLKGILPHSGLAFNMLAVPNDGEPQANGRNLIIDLQPTRVAVTRMANSESENSEPEAVEYHYPAGRTLSVDYIQNLVDRQSTQIFLSSQCSQYDQLIKDVCETDSNRYQRLTVSEASLPHADDNRSCVNLVSNAQRYFIAAKKSSHCIIAGKAPSPPLYQRRWFHVASSLLLVALVVVGLEHSQAKKLVEVKQQYVAAEKKLENTKASAGRLKYKIASLKTTKIELQETAGQLAQQQAIRIFLEENLPQRGWFVARFFVALSHSLHDNRSVVVNQVEETNSSAIHNSKIHVRAWSLTQVSAQRFIHSLSRATGNMGMRITSRKIKEKKGRLGIDGYEISIDLAPAFKKSSLTTKKQIAKSTQVK